MHGREIKFVITVERGNANNRNIVRSPKMETISM